jgi:Major Facilitator Superfamily
MSNSVMRSEIPATGIDHGLAQAPVEEGLPGGAVASDRRRRAAFGATAPRRHVNRWRAFALLAVAYFMTVVDFTIVNVSLPTIGRDLYLSATGLQWVVTAYALTLGGFLLLGGRAADLLGRRRILILGLALFTAHRAS